MAGKTLYDKLWDAHLVRVDEGGTALLYIDRHLVHEVTSPQAFEGLRLGGRRPWRAGSNVAVPDHNVHNTSAAPLPGTVRVRPAAPSSPASARSAPTSGVCGSSVSRSGSLSTSAIN